MLIDTNYTEFDLYKLYIMQDLYCTNFTCLKEEYSNIERFLLKSNIKVISGTILNYSFYLIF